MKTALSGVHKRSGDLPTEPSMKDFDFINNQYGKFLMIITGLIIIYTILLFFAEKLNQSCSSGSGTDDIGRYIVDYTVIDCQIISIIQMMDKNLLQTIVDLQQVSADELSIVTLQFYII